MYGFAVFRLANPTMTVELVLLSLIGILIDASMVAIASDRRILDEAACNYGAFYCVIRSLVIGYIPSRFPEMMGFEPPPITMAYGFILLFPLFIPLPKTKGLVAATIAALAQPGVTLLATTMSPGMNLLGRLYIASFAVVLLTWICAHVSPSLGAPSALRELGAYQLERLLRREPFSEVWLARHRHLARPAAIRTVHLPIFSGPQSEKTLQDFEQAAEAASRLRSPHTVALYDYGVTQGGHPYAVSEYIEGDDLARHVRATGPMRADEVIRLGLQMCDSLEEAHAKGLVHTDLRPENVILTTAGRQRGFIKLVRFGTAILGDTAAASSVKHSDLSSWVPPEVRAGQRSTQLSDVYQVGLILIHALTGRTPREPLALLSERALPRGLAEVMARATRRDPDERFASASELRAALEAIDPRGLDYPRLSYQPDDLSFAREGTAVGGPSSSKRFDWTERISTTLGLVRSTATTVPYPTSPPASPLPPEGWTEVSETSEPRGILEAARHRLVQVARTDALITTGLTLLSFADTSVNPTPHRMPVIAVSLGAILAIDAFLHLSATSPRVSTPAALRVGVAYFVVRSAVLTTSMIHGYNRLGIEPPAMTFAPLLILILPLFVPFSPARLFLPALIGAATEPLALAVLPSADTSPVWEGAIVTAIVVFSGSMFLAYAMRGSRRRADERASFGAYRLAQQIGQGGIGEVWRAEHELLARPAALKIVRAEHLEGPEGSAWKRRFEREARITARLTSPHTVTLYDYGVSDNGAAYSVMELLDGEDMERHVRRRGKLSPRDAALVLLQVCDSLAEAHAVGLVHRDLKPANLFLVRRTSEITVKVLDFGFAQSVDGRGDAASAARIVGTPTYMAPETFLAQPNDERSDIYQLGCVLFYLLTAHPVFEGRTLMGLAAAHIGEAPPTLASVSPDVAEPALEAIVGRCLEKQPDARFPNVESLEQALRAHLAAAEPEPAPRPWLGSEPPPYPFAPEASH